MQRRAAALLSGQSAGVEAFCVWREVFFRDGGTWRTRVEQLFPGYIFLATPHPRLLEEQLGLLGGRHDLLRQGSRVAMLGPHEVAFIERLADARTHLVAASRGVIRNGVTCVTEGPLKGNEHLIRKIDRHRRVAYLGDRALDGSSLMGEGCGMARVALEIYSKT